MFRKYFRKFFIQKKKKKKEKEKKRKTGINGCV